MAGASMDPSGAGIGERVEIGTQREVVEARPLSQREAFQRVLRGTHGLTDLPVVDEDQLLGAMRDPNSGLSVESTLGAFITTQQQMIIEAVREATRDAAPVAELLRMDKSQEFCGRQLKILHELGMMNLSVPEALGGGGQSFTTEALAVLAIAEIDAGIAAAYATNPLALKPILLAGTEGQKIRLVKPLVEGGKLAAYCQTEPGAGSDPASLATSIRDDGDSYILTGTKIWATNGAKADLLVVACRTAGSSRHKGISILAVPADLPGVRIGSSEDKLGQRLSNAAEITFEEARVPKENLIGPEGGGFPILKKTLSMARPNVAAIGLGVIHRAMQLGFDAANGREQFGKPILSNQGVQYPLAEAYTKYTSGLLLMIQATKAHDLGLPTANGLASMAKLQTSEDARAITSAMADLHGGTGYSNEAEISKLVRDAGVLPVYEGTSNIQRIILATAVQERMKRGS